MEGLLDFSFVVVHSLLEQGGSYVLELEFNIYYD